MTDNPGDYNNQSDHERYHRATALVSAVADLLARMLPYAPANMSTELDSKRLAHLAEHICQEALVAESLYVQLEERFNALRPAGCNLFGEATQVCLPLWFLSEEQLRQVAEQARFQTEQLDDKGQPIPPSMTALSEAVRSEMSERNIQPYRPSPKSPD